jgi:hypothetical protein
MERETKRSRAYRSSDTVSYEDMYNKVVQQYKAIWVQHKPIWVKTGLGNIYWCNSYHSFRTDYAFVANFRYHPSLSYSYSWRSMSMSKFGNGNASLPRVSLPRNY